MNEAQKIARSFRPITESIIARIEGGELVAGSRLPSERLLCDEFDVGRGTIRRALADLADRGYVATRRGAGTYVLPRHGGVEAPLDAVRTALEMTEVRCALECDAAALAARRRTDVDIAALKAANAAYSELDRSDADAMAAADYAFHLRLMQASGNPRFPEMLEASREPILAGMTMRYRDVSGQYRQAVKSAARDHARIIASIEAQDANIARREVKRHFQMTMRRYRSLLGLGDPAAE